MHEGNTDHSPAGRPGPDQSPHLYRLDRGTHSDSSDPLQANLGQLVHAGFLDTIANGHVSISGGDGALQKLRQAIEDRLAIGNVKHSANDLDHSMTKQIADMQLHDAIKPLQEARIAETLRFTSSETAHTWEHVYAPLLNEIQSKRSVAPLDVIDRPVDARDPVTEKARTVDVINGRHYSGGVDLKSGEDSLLGKKYEKLPKDLLRNEVTKNLLEIEHSDFMKLFEQGKITIKGARPGEKPLQDLQAAIDHRLSLAGRYSTEPDVDLKVAQADAALSLAIDHVNQAERTGRLTFTDLADLEPDNLELVRLSSQLSSMNRGSEMAMPKVEPSSPDQRALKQGMADLNRIHMKLSLPVGEVDAAEMGIDPRQIRRDVAQRYLDSIETLKNYYLNKNS